jgi:hypothetical protein
MKFKSSSVIECCFYEDNSLRELYAEKQKACDFDLFGLLCEELEFNIRAGAVESNMAEVIDFTWIYLSMEMWDFDVFNV